MSKIVGLCGPSASGKTTLAKRLGEEFDGLVINLDNYFLLKPVLTKYNELGKDRELPENVDWLAIKTLVESAQKGEVLSVRKMNWEDNTYSCTNYTPKKLVIMEGFLLLHDKDIVDMLDLSIYVDISDETGIRRRLSRIDGNEDADYLRKWYEEVTFPEYQARRSIFASRADLIIDGEADLNDNYQNLRQEVLKIL